MSNLSALCGQPCLLERVGGAIVATPLQFIAMNSEAVRRVEVYCSSHAVVNTAAQSDPSTGQFDSMSREGVIA